MMIVQNLSDFGWKFFSASSYSSAISTGWARSAGGTSLPECTEAVEDIVSTGKRRVVLILRFGLPSDFGDLVTSSISYICLDTVDTKCLSWPDAPRTLISALSTNPNDHNVVLFVVVCCNVPGGFGELRKIRHMFLNSQ